MDTPDRSMQQPQDSSGEHDPLVELTRVERSGTQKSRYSRLDLAGSLALRHSNNVTSDRRRSPKVAKNQHAALWNGQHVYYDKPISFERPRPISPELRLFYRDLELMK